MSYVQLICNAAGNRIYGALRKTLLIEFLGYHFSSVVARNRLDMGCKLIKVFSPLRSIDLRDPHDPVFDSNHKYVHIVL